MRVGLGQVNPTIGAFRQNTEKIKKTISEAKAKQVELLIFPELSVSGYPPRDLLDYPSFIEGNLRCLDTIKAATEGITVVCGFIRKNDSGVGCPFFNSASVMRDKEELLVYDKQLIPNYDVFDEARYFEPGEGPKVFELAGKLIGVTICEDIWNEAAFNLRRYSHDPVKKYAELGVDFLVNLSASPFAKEKAEKRNKLVQRTAAKIKAGVFLCNQVGGNDEILFDGGSIAVGADGNALAQAPYFEQDLTLFNTERAERTQPATEQNEATLLKALEMGLRDYVRKCGAASVGLGLSGGIDSSLVAAIAVRALGKENVWGVSLPTEFTSEASLEDARLLAERLGTRFDEFSIQEVFSGLTESWKKNFGESPEGLVLENFQPRLRMVVLMGLANQRGSLLLNTSNKSELAMGYSTLYGDSAGALSVLGDLEKGEVYQLAKFLNRDREIIPNRVLSRPPTAELRENQKDEDFLPSYEKLDPLVRRLAVAREALGATDEPVGKSSSVSAQFWASEYKRFQGPLVLRVSEKAFGVGRRVPIAAVHQER